MGERETAWMPECDGRPRRGGWAPGRYLKRCSSCGVEFVGGKRAVTCAPCAYIDVTILDAQREEAALPTLRTYDPTRERVVPLEASPSDVVVLSREDAALLHYVAKSWWALFGNSPRKIGKNTAWRALQAIRSALDGEG